MFDRIGLVRSVPRVPFHDPDSATVVASGAATSTIRMSASAARGRGLDTRSERQLRISVRVFGRMIGEFNSNREVGAREGEVTGMKVVFGRTTETYPVSLRL